MSRYANMTPEQKAVALVKAKAYRAANAEIIRAKRKLRYLKDPEGEKKKSAEWRAHNTEKQIASERLYREGNRKKCAESSARWRERDPNRAKELSRAWFLNNKDKIRIRDQRRYARYKNSPGKFSADDVKVLFSEQGGKCGGCGVSIDSGYEIDHVLPVVRGGSNWIYNIQLLCMTCNRKKHAKLPHVWFAEAPICQL